ncbi:ankyrin repeat-containing domain protein, partial [Syncephalis pseudoplumigaleata]
NAPSSHSGMTPMQYAASRGHLEVVQMLADQFNAFVDIADREGETALLKAAYNGHLPVVQCLVQRRANVHHRDRDGWTALHNACGRGHLRIVQHLVEHGSANIDVQSQQGHTPL